MNKYNEYDRQKIDQAILNLTPEEGVTFAHMYNERSKSHGTAIAVSLLTVIGVPFFYFGFSKFETWILVTWILGILLTYIAIGIIILIILEYFMLSITWEMVDEWNYDLKNEFLISVNKSI